MKGAARTVYIAGAGIAGLTLALGLAKFGVQVVVLERNSEISAFGAGLQISANARKVLDRLGLSEALAQRSFVPEGIDVFPDGRNRPLQTLLLGEVIAQRFGAPYSVMHRADLVEILHAAVKRFANIEIVFSVADFDVATPEGALTVTAREPDGRTRRARPFAFVGADGVGSKTRTAILGGPEAAYAGHVAWRALLPPDAVAAQVDLARTTLLLGSRFHLVVYPLPHRDAVNFALFTPDRSPPENTAPKVRPAGNLRLRHIMDAVGAGWTPWVLSSVEAPRWHAGPIGLVGDAAHAMLPFQAQGAAMAIEDAAILAPLLAASPNAPHAFARFEALRRERVERVAALSRENGRIFHMRRPLSLARDAVIRLQGPQGHFKRLGWLYGYDPHEGG